jgi:hypothetical protein
MFTDDPHLAKTNVWRVKRDIALGAGIPDYASCAKS